MRKIFLHGRLKQFGRCFELDVQTAGEAVRAIGFQVKGFLTALEEGSYEVVRGRRSDGFRLALEDVNEFRLGQGALHIVPVVQGHKQGGILKTILGVALVGAALFFSGGTLAAPLMGSFTYGHMAALGAALIFGGVSQMLSGPEEKDKDDKQDSFTLNGPGNIYTQGSPVPLIYGEVITGGLMISGGIDVEDIPVGS